MKVWENILKKLRKDISIQPEKFWESLDEMPLFNWRKCIDGSLIYVRRETLLNTVQNESDEAQWTKLFDEYIKKYGLGKLYKKWIDISVKKSLAECEFVKTRDRFALTKIELEEAKLKSLIENKGEGVGIEKTLIYLSKWVGYRINEKEISVSEYFNLMEEYGKANKTK